MDSVLQRIISSRKGTSTVLYALAFTAIIGFTALAVDVGMAFLEKSRLSATVDSAALAGAQELIANKDNARYVVNSYIYKNMGTLDQINITTDESKHSIEVKGSKTIDSYFAKILGIQKFNISSMAAAKVENIRTLKGTRPLAVINQTFNYGVQYTLKEGAGDGISGNYAAISLGNAGADVYRNNLLSGYPGTLTVNDMILTETGNIAGITETSINQLILKCPHTPPCTYQYYNKNCTRIIFIPVVNTLEVNGRKYVKVLGFATFFLEGVVNRGGTADVIGRFITYSANGETSSEINDYGTYGIRLIK